MEQRVSNWNEQRMSECIILHRITQRGGASACRELEWYPMRGGE